MPAWVNRALVGAVAVAHLGGAWALMQWQPVRDAVAQIAPLVVDIVAASSPAAPTPPPPAAPPPRPVPRPSPPPAPVVAAAPSAEPAPAAMVVPPPPSTPTAVAEPVPLAPMAPVASVATAAAAPRTVPSTAVSYLEPPSPVYPRVSRRLGEQGEVLLKVEIGTDGRARQVLVSRSSGHARLDEAALVAVRAARFRPYTDNGVPQVVWTTVPIQFELENKP